MKISEACDDIFVFQQLSDNYLFQSIQQSRSDNLKKVKIHGGVWRSNQGPLLLEFNSKIKLGDYLIYLQNNLKKLGLIV